MAKFANAFKKKERQKRKKSQSKLKLITRETEQSLKPKSTLFIQDTPKLFYAINEQKVLSMVLDVLNILYK